MKWAVVLLWGMADYADRQPHKEMTRWTRPVRNPLAQLLRKSYRTALTRSARFLYLPAGYEADPERLWPVMLFLHGGGLERDGRRT